MKTKDAKNYPYLVRIYWDDGYYAAEVPALPGCAAHGVTFVEAAREIQVAMDLWMEGAEKHGVPIPEADLAREEMSRVAPYLSVAKLARRAGLNRFTLASKLRRRTKFTAEETKAILDALKPA